MGDEVQQIVIAGLDPPAGPKPLRRGEGPAIRRAKRISALMDARVILREDGASRLLPVHDDLGTGQPS